MHVRYRSTPNVTLSSFLSTISLDIFLQFLQIFNFYFFNFFFNMRVNGICEYVCVDIFKWSPLRNLASTVTKMCEHSCWQYLQVLHTNFQYFNWMLFFIIPFDAYRYAVHNASVGFALKKVMCSSTVVIYTKFIAVGTGRSVEAWHDVFIKIYMYSSPSILQPSILRPPLFIRPLDLVPKGNFQC